MESDGLSNSELDALADQVIKRLDTGRYGDRFVFTRRQVVALAGAGLSVGALTALGVDEATAQEAVGQIGDEANRVDVFANDVDARSVTTGDTHTERIGNGVYHYAGDYPGNGPDDRLDAAISDASDGETIYLEPTGYDASRTISKDLVLNGANEISSSAISGDWTFDAQVTLSNVYINVGDDNAITINDRSVIKSCRGGSGANVQVETDDVRIYGCFRFSVTFGSGTSGGIVDASVSLSVTDNGSNSVGDIA